MYVKETDLPDNTAHKIIYKNSSLTKIKLNLKDWMSSKNFLKLNWIQKKYLQLK